WMRSLTAMNPLAIRKGGRMHGAPTTHGIAYGLAVLGAWVLWSQAIPAQCTLVQLGDRQQVSCMEQGPGNGHRRWEAEEESPTKAACLTALDHTKTTQQARDASAWEAAIAGIPFTGWLRDWRCLPSGIHPNMER